MSRNVGIVLKPEDGVSNTIFVGGNTVIHIKSWLEERFAPSPHVRLKVVHVKPKSVDGVANTINGGWLIETQPRH